MINENFLTEKTVFTLHSQPMTDSEHKPLMSRYHAKFNRLGEQL